MSGSVCYVVPFFSETDDQHFAHLPRLLGQVAALCDLYVIVERGGVAPDIPGAKMVLMQRTDPRHRVRRYMELLHLVRRVRRAGCRRFFVRISKGAALILIGVRWLFGVEVFYWNSGQGRRAQPVDLGPFARIRLWIGDQLLGVIIRRADRFVTGPESMVDYYVEEYGARRSRSVVLYNDVDTEVFRPSAAGDRETLRDALDLPRTSTCVLFLGRVSRYKGGEFLLPLAEALRASTDTEDVRIVVVGSVHLTHLQSRLEADPTISLVGARPNPEVVSYIRAVDLLVLPSLSEGFPRVVLEAMACGLPVAAFDVGGVKDIFGSLQLGCVVPRGDLTGLAATIRRIVSDEDLARRLGAENRNEVRRFSTEAVAQMFVERIVSR